MATISSTTSPSLKRLCSRAKSALGVVVRVPGHHLGQVDRHLFAFAEGVARSGVRKRVDLQLGPPQRSANRAKICKPRE
jgi:hypothetical protein